MKPFIFKYSMDPQDVAETGNATVLKPGLQRYQRELEVLRLGEFASTGSLMTKTLADPSRDEPTDR